VAFFWGGSQARGPGRPLVKGCVNQPGHSFSFSVPGTAARGHSSLPHPGGGEVPAGSPRAIEDPSRQPQGNPHRLFSLLRKRDQVKDPRKNWGLSDTCQLEPVISSLSKAECFKITALNT
jgi:hypothetical protein